MLDVKNLSEEIICGYTVSENRKKLWVIEIDMLNWLEATCKRHGLNYFLLFGSALGVVRHKGFIPWDDDIDIGMLREDFEELLRVAKNEIPDDLEIQYGISNGRVDKLLRIRNKNTTGIIRTDRNIPGNKGVFIEIYPFDYVPSINWCRKVQLKLSGVLLKLMYRKIGMVHDNKARIVRFIPISVNMYWKLYQAVCRAQNHLSHVYVDTIGIPSKYTMKGEHLFRYCDVKESVYGDFEYIKARIPVGYDHVLSTRYGDYMTLPPENQRGIHHDNIVFYDPTKPYTNYDNESIVDEYFRGDVSKGLL